MKLSVMVISHNQAHLIHRCLDSILAQRIDAPWEIVISDDASTDNTWDMIQEYVQRYSEAKKMVITILLSLELFRSIVLKTYNLFLSPWILMPNKSTFYWFTLIIVPYILYCY